ncbi:MAG: lysophospholipase L1-like esterase [Myxococcota bacterium]
MFGHGVRETEVFSVVAAELLSQRWQRPVLSLNGAVPGHDSSQSRAVLRELDPALRADWVVIGSMWSDVYRDRRASLPPRVLFVRGMMRELALYRLLRRLLSRVMSSESIRWIDDDEDITPLSPAALEAYRHNLQVMARDTSERGGCPVFLLLPAPIDFDVVAVPEAVSAHREAMRSVAAAADAPLLDGPALLAGEAGWRGLFLDQVHPSATGHERLGVALAAMLSGLGPECD